MIDRQVHQPALDLIGRSAIARSVSSVSRRIESAAGRARSVEAAAMVAGAWRRMNRSQRRRAIGVTLITAAAIHSLMTVLHQVPAGWIWLVVPVITVAEGVLLIAASGASTADYS